MVEDEEAESLVMKAEESKRFMENVGRCSSLVVVYCKRHDKFFGNQASATVCFSLVIFLLYRPFSFTVYAYDVLIKWKLIITWVYKAARTSVLVSSIFWSCSIHLITGWVNFLSPMSQILPPVSLSSWHQESYREKKYFQGQTLAICICSCVLNLFLKSIFLRLSERFASNLLLTEKA